MLNNKDPRILRTRRAFEEALLKLMEDSDFEKITVSALAKEAKLNRATFYLHYEDKEDLLDSYLTRELKKFKQKAVIEKEEFSFDISKPHPLYVRVFEYLEEKHTFFKTMLAHDANSPIIYSVIDIIESFVQENEKKMAQNGINFTVEIELSKTYFTHAFLGTIIWWLKNDMPYSPRHMAKQLTIISTIGPYEDNPFFLYAKRQEQLKHGKIPKEEDRFLG